MGTSPKVIFGKITKMEVSNTNVCRTAILSAKASGHSLSVVCGDLGSSFSVTSYGEEEVHIIGKGSLSSVSYYTSRSQSLANGVALLIVVGIGLYYLEYNGYFFAWGLGFLLFVWYILSRKATLEFESSGGRSVIFYFSGRAANSSGLAKFCTAVIEIDKGIYSKESHTNSNEEMALF